MRRRAWPGLKTTRPVEVTNPTICGRKLCSSCGHWRHLVEFVSLHGQPRNQCQACLRIKQRDAYRARTAEQMERRREYERIYREVHRRARGVPVRPRGPRARPTYVDLHVERVLLAAGPLVKALDRTGEDWEAIARRSGVPARSLWRWRSGEAQLVRIDLADRIAFAIGVPLSLIYLGCYERADWQACPVCGREMGVSQLTLHLARHEREAVAA